MRKSIALVVAGLAAGFVIAAWWGGSSLKPTPDSRDSLTTEKRLDALEAELAFEARRRVELEAELALLNQRIAESLPVEGLESIDSSDSPEDRSETVEQAPVAEAPAPRRVVRVGPPAAIDERNLVERFIAAGITPERAQWIVARSEELRMQALQEQYDAARENRPIDPALAGRMTTLRNELGDTDYERYLQALGLPTNVQVGRVLATSPGAQAGIKAGDQIVSFDGERVFDMRDINRLTLEGEPGQMVAVDVMRDGQLVQLYVPRGPIGIMGGRDGPPFR
jgi:membrane-associated protease RseP (regulator of RpoE activity)